MQTKDAQSRVDATRMLIEQGAKTKSLDELLKDVRPETSLRSFLLPLLGDMSWDVFAQLCCISRSFIYLAMDGKRKPDQDVLLRMAFVLSLTPAKTQQLLKTGGRALLTANRTRDVAIIYGLENRLSLGDMDEILREKNLGPLVPPEKG